MLRQSLLEKSKITKNHDPKYECESYTLYYTHHTLNSLTLKEERIE